jgi:hypothetical protein
MDINEYLILFGAVFAIALILLFWAAYIRKPGRHHSRHHHSRAREEGAAASRSSAGDDSEKHHHHHRRRRHEYPRNPTLAETGGLPPVKPEQSSDPMP